MAMLEFSGQPRSYLGFDRNEYPGDENLNELRKTFDYTGYWLNSPPGASANTWIGKRARLQRAGFGFLALFNGRLYSELKTIGTAAKLGMPTRNPRLSPRGAKGFPMAPLFFSTRSRVAACCPNRRRTSRRGWMELASQACAQAFIVLEFQLKKEITAG